MPSRGSYQVANVPQGKAAQRDQSYRSCIAMLLIFFFLCIILILVAFPWKTYHSHHSDEDEYIGTVQHHHRDHTEQRTEETTETTKSTKYYLTTTTAINENNSEQVERVTSNFEVGTENSNVVDTTNQIITNTSNFDEFLNIETSTEILLLTDSVIDIQTVTSTINVDFAVTEISNSTIEEYQEESTTDNYITSTTIDTNFVNGETSIEEDESTINDVTKYETKNEESTTIKFITENLPNIDNHSTQLTTMKDNTTTITTTSRSPIIKEVCITGECKNLASKILFYMNHSVEPCDDFYEYACGGFEANPQTIDQNLEEIAYQRILRQMQKENREHTSSPFTEYYNSCVEYENINRTERIELAKKVLNKVGKFYTTIDWDENHTNFTELLGNLLIYHSALLFDISPDLDEYSPKQLTLKIGPTTYKNPFDVDETTNHPCYAAQFEREKETVDLGHLYTEYEACTKNTRKFIESISEAWTALGVFSELNNAYNISQYIHSTRIKIDLEIVQNFFANFPSKDKIREAYLMKNYTLITIKELEENFKIVNWTRVIWMLTKELVKPESKVQVYFYDALAKGLKNLEEFGNNEPMNLHNAVLGLYARYLYQNFVLSKHLDAKKDCLRIATNILTPEASILYLSSFSEDQLTYMTKTINSLFETHKETLKLKIAEIKWATQEEQNMLIAKIDDLKVTVPDIRYYPNSDTIYKINLSDNYLENSVTLMQRYRKLIYAELFTYPGYPEQIWAHYATPYQSKGLAIYGLNFVVIPFGVIDWSTKHNELSFDYIKLATLGNIIAYQIAHHFDANGIYYWNGTRNTNNSLLNNNDSINTNFEKYIDSQREILYQNRMSMTLSSTGQNVFYEISQLSLNERLSEIMGLRLAYDTLARLRSREEVHLPWLELDVNQLFYLAYAQMHCTKSPLTSSYISLYENEQLPSRILIFISASNNRLLGEAWNCPDGSKIMPSFVCNAFPYLQCNDIET